MTNSTNASNKSLIRQQVKDQLLQLSTTARHAFSSDITSLLTEQITQLDHIKTIACFAASDLEPNTAGLHYTLHATRFVYPLCSTAGIMQFHLVDDPKKLVPGKFGILAPDPQVHPLVSPSEIDLILCPAYAYTPTGERLGKGGGYYDRYIAQYHKLPSTPLCIGVAFSQQLRQSLPIEPHDMKVDLLVTEVETLRF